MICQNCEQKLSKVSRYCENCGALVNQDISIDQVNPKKPTKTWVWIVVIVLILVGCLCVAVAGGGILYFRNQDQSLQDLVSNTPEEQTQVPAVSTNTPIPEEEVQVIPQAETLEIQSDVWADSILAITGSAIWAVNEQTHETVQISTDQVDIPWDINDGLSPDKKYFAYITGFSGASVNPMLVVLDIEKKASILQLELTGQNIQSGAGGTPGDPAFEAFGAIQYTDNLAWSPDGTRFAFIAARDGDSADVYLFSPTDNSVTRLSDEAGHAAALHWSPDGQLLQYFSVNSFGTGAGFDMEALWVYDFQNNQAHLLEMLESNGEDFLAWTDSSQFLINSTSRTCGGAYNLRIVDAVSSEQQVIVDEGFTAVAYDPENKFGMFSVAYNYDNCGSSEPLDPGLMIFGEGIGNPIAGEIGRKKFEQIIVYGIGFIPQEKLFTIYGDEGLQTIYFDNGYYSLSTLPEVNGLTPFPSSTGNYWAWASRVNSGLWITENNSNPLELSPLFTGIPLWSQDGQSLYFFENNRLFLSSAPQFSGGTLVAEIPGQEILAIIK